MIISTDLTNDEVRLNMTGELEDVANIISPSPRRKPGIVNYSSHISKKAAKAAVNNKH